MTDGRPLAGFSDAEISALAHIAISGRLVLLPATKIDPAATASAGKAFLTVIFTEMRERGMDPVRYHATLIQRALEATGADVAEVFTLDDESRKKAGEN
jgi:hypothetical protein